MILAHADRLGRRDEHDRGASAAAGRSRSRRTAPGGRNRIEADPARARAGQPLTNWWLQLIAANGELADLVVDALLNQETSFFRDAAVLST